MISPESFVFANIAPTIREEYNAFVAGEDVEVPTKFPAVTIVEASNSVYTKMRTRNIENAVKVMYEVNVYDNTVGEKKQKVKKIVAAIDTFFAEMGFTRTFGEPMSVLQDSTIYRFLMRYEGVVDNDFRVYTD